MDKQATIRDVAEKAGVSLATASRVMNDASYPVSAQLRKKVKDAAECLHYVPNAMARSLKGEVTKDIGLVIPSISNPFYHQTIQGISDVLRQNDYSLILCNTIRDPKQEEKYLRQLFERRVKGVILSSMDDKSDVINEYIKKGMKFILLDQKLEGVDSAGVKFDTRAGARMATEYLISKGHRQIAFATLPMTRRTRVETYQGYQDALSIAGIPFREKLIYEKLAEGLDSFSDPELETGSCIARAFLADKCPATAFVCINDMLAIGLIKTLVQNGVKVPEDVSVFGFDDIPFASAFMPSLSTVHYPAVESGRFAAYMMLDLLQNEKPEMSVVMQLTPSLVIRDSVAEPKTDDGNGG